ncbi:proline-rich protein 33-like [Dromiciops gliroides]|uniref:proline-rich protein 33-like n=1 Tax=Dromiciops gliroides TaxID=33562 RepID=UPI001CC79C79|nr:proline-rich protein 33-like [Dromiciops gliroides]
MLITVPMPHEPGSPYPPALPPPLLPKPAKDNLRLQRLLRKAAKKKGSLTTLQISSFRASLSPVSEASHDQDVVPQPHPEMPGAAAPPAPPSPLALPSPSRILLPASRSPYKPVIQHVPSPLQKKSFFNLTEQRSLAEHFRMTTPQLGGPGPGPLKPPGTFTPVSAPREVTHISRVHIHVGPVVSPPSPAPVANLTMGGWGNREQDPPRTEPQDTPRTEPQEWPGVTHEPSPTPQIPVAHIQPLTPNAQATSPGPEPLPSSRLSPSTEVTATKQVITRIVVPIAPTAKAEPPPVLPKPSTVYPKFVAASDAKQQPQGPPSPSRAFPPESPRDPLVSSGPSPTPHGEVGEAAPTHLPRGHFGGWSRLKKQLIVSPEALAFPEATGAKALLEQASEAPREPAAGPGTPRPLVSRAAKMWDAVLYRMSVAKGGNQQDTKEGARAPPGRLPGHGSFLPFLYRPRFDARKLQEMAAQAPAKVNSVQGLSLRPSMAPKNFNRTAACWQLK